MSHSLKQKPQMPRSGLAMALGLLLTWCCPVFAQQSSPAGGQVVLSERDCWRKQYTFSPPVIAAADGTTSAAGKQDSVATTVFQAPPPKTWVQVEFDPAGWLTGPGQEFTIGGDPRFIASQKPGQTSAYLRGTDASLPAISLLCQRGSFLLGQPKQVRGLSLSLTYRGGFVACLNGKEIARAHVPTGALEPSTPGEAYSADALFTQDSLDKNKPAPAELARQCRALLDERTNVLRLWQLKQAHLAPQLWQERNRRLFDLAGQVQKAGS